MSTTGTGRRMLGLGCGQPHGSAEILLKAALRAAEDQGAEVELVRLDELRLPSGSRGGRRAGRRRGGCGSGWSSATG